jgi:dethiobiotin synthetase
VIGAWPAQPGVAEIDNRDALSRLAPVRAALPAGAGSLGRADFERLSVDAFDPSWVEGLAT